MGFSALKSRFSVLFVLLGLMIIGPARAETYNDADRTAIRGVIQAQMEAFARDDAPAAFGFATTALQTQFGSPSRFLALVREAYAPVYRPGSVWFGALKSANGVPAQMVHLTDSKGAAVLALYIMERQKDGSWRIAGCQLLKDPGLDS
ncbi:MAG: DUF4864 domain-containing protein [Elstera sp.]